MLWTVIIKFFCLNFSGFRIESNLISLTIFKSKKIAIPEIKRLLDVLKDIISHFKMSGKSATMLRSQQEKVCPDHVWETIAACKTRWNSGYRSLGRAIVIFFCLNEKEGEATRVSFRFANFITSFTHITSRFYFYLHIPFVNDRLV
jgi:hypothetical protein